MAEAVLKQHGGTALNTTAAAARTAGEVIVTPQGLAGVYPCDIASGAVGALETEGIFLVAKTADLVMLEGEEVYWDHSANSCTQWAVDDKDFFLGTVVKDVAGSATTVTVHLNKRNPCIYNMHGAGAVAASRTVMTMTTAAGAPAGGIMVSRSGGSLVVKFGTAAEAQCADQLSVRSVPVASKWIFAGVITVIADADADVGDVNLGVASGTSTSDADAITTSAFMHLDLTGADLKIYAESDNAAAEVNATDTTKTWAAGTPIHFMIDGRSGDGSGLKYYVNGIRVLSGTAFTVAGAAGPLKALFIIEKSSNDSPGSVALDDMRIWLSEDAAA